MQLAKFLVASEIDEFRLASGCAFESFVNFLAEQVVEVGLVDEQHVEPEGIIH